MAEYKLTFYSKEEIQEEIDKAKKHIKNLEDLLEGSQSTTVSKEL